MANFGGKAGDKFIEGDLRFKYIVTDGTLTSFLTVEQLFTCTSDCCINNKLASIQPCGCDEDAAMDELIHANLHMQGAKAAAGCGKTKRALELLGAVQKYCSNKDCGCN